MTQSISTPNKSPVFYGPPEFDETCTICLTDIKIKDVFRLCCGHKFHEACFRSWENYRPVCPICRRPTQKYRTAYFLRCRVRSPLNQSILRTIPYFCFAAVLFHLLNQNEVEYKKIIKTYKIAWENKSITPLNSLSSLEKIRCLTLYPILFLHVFQFNNYHIEEREITRDDYERYPLRRCIIRIVPNITP